MAYPYKANDEDEDFKDLDPAVAEEMAIAKALQISLKNPQNDATKPPEKKSERTSEKTSGNNFAEEVSHHITKDTTGKGTGNDKMAKKDAETDRILVVKMASLLGTINCPDTYDEAPQGLISGLIPGLVGADSPNSSTGGVAGSDPGQDSLGWSADIADMAIPSQVLGCPDAADTAVEQASLEAINPTVKAETETAVAGSSAPTEGSSSALDDVVAFGVSYDADESGRGRHFDDEVARAHAARVAEIEAALNSQNAHLEEVLSARHAGRLSRDAPVAISAQAARNQIAPAGPSHREAGDSAGDEEMDWLLGEFPVSPRPGSEEAQSPRQGPQRQ
ncbi:hypothetical protein FJTKL_08674 [Diaporthe vaccinii]|uniref:Uncharacterized protein n=1 Tax=Diaporthe vaccinii TaxID=105482 RepID=A0ABR4EQY7_9PEZI